MGSMFSKFKDKIRNGGPKQAVRQTPRQMSQIAPNGRAYAESSAPAVPWSSVPVGPDSFTRPVELPAPGEDSEARPSAARDRLEREKAERWRVEQRMAQRQESASTPNIRRLRQLIRKKYKLDVYIWSKRRVQKAMRPEIQECAKKSDEILQEIIFIVNDWGEDVFNGEEWMLAERLKESLDRSNIQHLVWAGKPAWEREEREYTHHQAEYSPGHGQTNGGPWT